MGLITRLRDIDAISRRQETSTISTILARVLLPVLKEKLRELERLREPQA